VANQVLLLNSTNEVLSFISEKKAIRLVYKNKADTISIWEEIKLSFANGFMFLPSVLRMKYYIKKIYKQLIFSRKAILRRDKFSCGYCGKKLSSGHATIDHIVPKSLGGTSTFTNCVAACFKCNSKKGNQTLEQAEMKLKVLPVQPVGYIFHLSDDECWHSDWNKFLENK
jgi:hypothetical protein